MVPFQERQVLWVRAEFQDPRETEEILVKSLPMDPYPENLENQDGLDSKDRGESQGIRVPNKLMFMFFHVCFKFNK